MTDITQDLRVVAIDNDSYAQAVAAARAYRIGDDPRALPSRAVPR